MLIYLQAKQGRAALTPAEKDIKKESQDDHFNTPQPLHIYLAQMGDVMDEGGKRTEVEVPPLRTVTAGNRAG